MTNGSRRVYSDMPIPPGEILVEELTARGMTQKELAGRMGRPYQVISEIANAKKAITPDTAIQLGTVLGQDPEYWLNLENSYQLVLARRRELDKARTNQAWLNAYPIAAMTERGWLDPSHESDVKMASLLRFLGAVDADPAKYIETAGFELPHEEVEQAWIGALGAWLRKGELEAETAEAADFDSEAFEQALDEIRLMTELPPAVFLPMLINACASAGVVFQMIETFCDAPVKAAARWLNKSRALIQLSADEQAADSFWLSFFHSAGLLLRNPGDRKIHVDGIGVDIAPIEFENQADKFAWTHVIPDEDWQSFCAVGNFETDNIWEFAMSIDTSPFMVESRLEQEGLFSSDNPSDFKHTYSWSTRCEPLQPDHTFLIGKEAQSGNWIGLLHEIGDPYPIG